MKNQLWGLLIGLVLTVFFTYPLLSNFSTHLTSKQDGILVAWLINWGSQSLKTGESFTNAPYFYPYQNTISYSDLFFSTALLNTPLTLIEQNITWLTKETNLTTLNFLIINHNLHLFLGSILTFWGQYLLGLYLFKSKKIATLSGIIFAFSNMHLHYIVHLHVFLIAGIPFYFLFLFKFIKTKKNIFILLSSLAIIYQLLNSPMSGVFIIVMSLITLINKNIKTILWKKRKTIAPYLVGSILLVSFFYLPYFIVNNQFHYTRTIRDTAHFAFSLNKFLSLEIVFYIGLLLSLTKIKKKLPLTKEKKLPSYFWLFLFFAIIGALLMLGPALKINDQIFKIFGLPIPLPYIFFYYLFPGFKAFRASSRWIIVFAFGLSIIIGYLIKDIQGRLKFTQPHKKGVFFNAATGNKVINLLIAITTILLWVTQIPQLKTFEINTQLPPIYEVIKNRKENVLAEFPTYVWSQYDQYYREAERLLYQSYHHKKLYNGFSGFAPPERELLWHAISSNLEKKEMVQHLQNSGVELVLLHGSENSDYQNFTSPYYQLITCKQKDCLYYLK